MPGVPEPGSDESPGPEHWGEQEEPEAMGSGSSGWGKCRAQL